jgi:hypothetical protein
VDNSFRDLSGPGPTELITRHKDLIAPQRQQASAHCVALSLPAEYITKQLRAQWRIILLAVALENYEQLTDKRIGGIDRRINSRSLVDLIAIRYANHFRDAGRIER